jgi:hypothetical protein
MEYFVEQLEAIGFSTNNIAEFENEIILAKEMEKEEQRKLGIILAIFAEEIGDKKFTQLLIKAEQYYKKTFKSE